MLQRPNWVEINLDAIESNVKYIKSLVPEHTKILLPVKADAYGHGSLACSYAAQKFGIDYLGVAHVFEGINLRQHGVTLPILVLGTAVKEDFDYLVSYNLTPTISSLELARSFSNYLVSHFIRHTIHIKVDTGMNRYGFKDDIYENTVDIIRMPGVIVEGLYSHLATADEAGSKNTQKQIKQFLDLIKALKQVDLKPKICHIANSAATFNNSEISLDMIRPGISLYGYDPMGFYDKNLTPSLTMTATVRHIHTVKRGQSVSYGHIWTASKDTKIATVAIGYGDGYPRGNEDDGSLFIGGEQCQIVGRICMDATMVDVSHIKNIKVGDEVKVIDGDHAPRISIENLAKRHDTISYEIACQIARRMYRFYRFKGQRMRWDQLKEELEVQEFNPDRGIPL